MKQITPLIILAIITTLFSCKGTEKQETQSEDTNSELIELTAQQIEAVGIELGSVELKNLSSVVRANGQLVLPPQNEAAVNSLTSGIVKEIAVTEGVSVRKGQRLVLLENLDIVRLQQEYLTLRQQLTVSRQEYDRQQELSAQNAGTGKVLQQTQAKYEADQAQLKGLETQLRQLNISPAAVAAANLVTAIPITAPIGGIVGKIFVKTGSYADMQTVLMEIADHSQMHCDLQVFEQDFPKIKRGQTVEISLTNQGNQTITGTVDHTNQSFENDSKSIIIHVKIDKTNTQQLLPGMYVSALINTGSQTTQAVPTTAIANAEGRQYIFVKTDGDDNGAECRDVARHVSTFKKIEITTGVSELGFVEIKPMETLPENAVIITKGAFYVMSKISGGEEEE